MFCRENNVKAQRRRNQRLKSFNNRKRTMAGHYYHKQCKNMDFFLKNYSIHLSTLIWHHSATSSQMDIITSNAKT